MNNWIIMGIVFGLFVIGGIALVSAISIKDNPANPEVVSTCSSCGNSCTAENNCGLATCGAKNGGTCNCGR